MQIKQPVKNNDVCGGCVSPHGICNTNALECECISNYSMMPDCSLSDEEAANEKALISSSLTAIKDMMSSSAYYPSVEVDQDIINLLSIICKEELLT